MSREPDILMTVAAVTSVAEGIKRFDLMPERAGPLPRFAAGAHVIISLRDGERVYRNPYSLMGPPDDPSRYSISVLRTENSRGGSHFLHDQVSVGSRVAVSPPINLFPIDQTARHHLLIAGGIGITPLMAMAEQLRQGGVSFTLHYCVRDRARAAYAEDLAARHRANFHFHVSGEGGKLDLDGLLGAQNLGTHLYVCGPAGMIDGVLNRAEQAGWPAENCHSERFTAPLGGQPFTVHLARAARSLPVGAHQSILEAVEAAGINAPYLCRGGACGQCETAVLSSDGTLLHQDHFLSAEQQQAGRRIMICVSRCVGGDLTLDL